MNNILILGATGKLGRIILSTSLEEKFNVTVLIRDINKLNIENNNLKIIQGQVTLESDLSLALKNIDVVISTLGHGFRTKFPIQENTLKILLPLMKKNNINRLITITGAGLRTNNDPNSLTLNISEKLFSFLDPYRISDAKNQQDLLEKSALDWTIIRTPLHSNKGNIKIKYAGFKQPKPWQKVSRKAISNFMIECIRENKWIKKSPIIY